MTDTRHLPGPLLDHWDWQLLGRCRGKGSELFFHPENERGPRRAAREAAAKAVCRECPVMLICRQHALASHEPYGVWGGMSEDERARLLGRGRTAKSGLTSEDHRMAATG